MVAGQLVLGAVLLAPRGSQDLLAEQLRAAVPGFEVSVRHVHAADVAGMLSNCTVTIVGQAITGADVSALAATMAAGGANIIRIDRVADYPVTVLALEVLAPDPARPAPGAGGALPRPRRRRRPCSPGAWPAGGCTWSSWTSTRR